MLQISKMEYFKETVLNKTELFGLICFCHDFSFTIIASGKKIDKRMSNAKNGANGL